MPKYWDDRLQRIAHSLYMSQQEKEKLLIKAYREGYEEANGVLGDLFLKYSKEGELSATELMRYGRLDKMGNRFKSIAYAIGTKEVRFAKKHFPSLYTESLRKAGDIIGIDWSIIPKAQIEKAITYPWSGADYSSRIWDNKAKLVKNLKETVTRGIVQGKSNTQMMNQLKDVMGKSAYECRRIVRTESMHLINAGQIDTYKKSGVKELEWLTAHDERLCPDCRAMDGRIFPFNEAPMLPLHPNCRCTYIPVL